MQQQEIAIQGKLVVPEGIDALIMPIFNLLCLTCLHHTAMVYPSSLWLQLILQIYTQWKYAVTRWLCNKCEHWGMETPATLRHARHSTCPNFMKWLRTCSTSPLYFTEAACNCPQCIINLRHKEALPRQRWACLETDTKLLRTDHLVRCNWWI